jgi:GT2 family glycosyltransferase
VIVLGYGQEPGLADCVAALLASRDVELEVVLVDNGCTVPGLVDAVEASSAAVRVARPGRNLGFAGGCNAGVAEASGEILVFVNADVVVSPTAIASLLARLSDPAVGLVTASVRLASDPELINSCGNPLNILGLSWAGHHGEPAADHLQAAQRAVVCGAAFACRRETWAALGGFDPLYFAYHEDTELSIRCWQLGQQVWYVPEAVVTHRYEFTRNTGKYYLLERNRLINLLTLWETRTVLVLAPLLVGFELAALLLAARQGWLGEKLRGYEWLWRNRASLRSRRRRVQRARRVRDHELIGLLTPSISANNIDLPTGIRWANGLFAGYWGLARRLL